MKKKLMRIIKMATIFSIIGIFLQAFLFNIVFALAPTNGQDLDNVLISLDLEGTSLLKVFKQIEANSQYKFVYDKKEIPLKNSTTIHAKDTPLNSVLMELAKQHNITFKRINKQIVVKKKYFIDKKGKGKIKGVVLDSRSKEPLIGANVIIKGTSMGAAANMNGEFVLPKIKAGNYILKISYVGYKEKEMKVTVVPNRVLELNIKLDWIAVEGDVVLVTAQAKGQLSAINEQLSADEIKNVVSKDRIRELPDANAAESVGRLPGVSIQRSGGEGDKVVIRGLSPKYSKVMLDGVSLAATGNNDRSVSLNSISSYSLEGIEVIKAPTADMDGDQIGGSVNFKMKTATQGFNSHLVIQGAYNNLKKSYSDYMIVADVSNRFFDDKLGIFAQVTSDKKDLSSNQMGAGYYFDKDRNRSLRTESLTLRDVVRERQRLGGTLTLDYLLSAGKIYLKNFLSYGNNNENAFSESFYRSRGHNYNSSSFDNNLLIYSNILGFEHDISIFRMKLKLSHSYSETDALDNIFFNFSKSNDMNEIPLEVSPKEIPYYANNDIDNTTWGSYGVGDKITKGTEITASLDLESDFTLSKQINGKIKFGGKVNYSEHSFDNKNGYYGNMNPQGGAPYRIAVLEAFPWMQKIKSLKGVSDATDYDMPYTLFIDHNFNHEEFLKGKYEMGPVADIELMHKVIDVLKVTHEHLLSIGAAAPEYFSPANKTNVTNDYMGFEHLYAGYVMADVDITNRLKFIPGIRYESKWTSYSGVRGKTGVHAQENYPHIDTTTIRTNNFLLPRALLRYKAFDWLQVRIAYTQSVARPSYAKITPRVDIPLGANSVSVNNFKLRPEKAASYDINFAFSDNYIGLFTIGAFYKEIEDKIFLQKNRILENPEKFNLEQIYKGRFYTTAENNKDLSYVRGIELDWQTNFWYLPSFLKGIVLNINYTKLISRTKYPLTKYTSKVITTPPFLIKEAHDNSYWGRMQLQPDDIVNISLGYDYKGFSSRLSMFYQGDNFISSSFYEEEHIYTDSYLRWDLSLKQKLPWQNIQLYCNIVNLTQTIDRDFILGNKKDNKLQYYGSNVQVGLRWGLN